jgi:hypothetical protein
VIIVEECAPYSATFDQRGGVIDCPGVLRVPSRPWRRRYAVREFSTTLATTLTRVTGQHVVGGHFGLASYPPHRDVTTVSSREPEDLDGLTRTQFAIRA